MEEFTIRRIDGKAMSSLIDALTDILVDCVEGGSSVSFMSPMSRPKGHAFWQRVLDDVSHGRRVLMVAFSAQGRAVGTAQLIVEQPENQPHRADVSKMLVHRSARRLGIGRALMRAIEQQARDIGKTLLVLDTANDGAQAMYSQLGWIELGAIPNYALMPDGVPCATTIMYKNLAAVAG